MLYESIQEYDDALKSCSRRYERGEMSWGNFAQEMHVLNSERSLLVHIVQTMLLALVPSSL